MKSKITLICSFIFALLLPLHAEKSKAEDSDVKDEKKLPEYSTPPYSVGDRAVIQGYYIPLADDISLNFRVLNNRMYVYWVDADDLIVEPQSLTGNIRFVAGVRGKNYYTMELLPGEDGLGSVGGPVLEPHTFTVILSLRKPDSDKFEMYTFRYTFPMSAVREKRKLTDENTTVEETGYRINYKSKSAESKSNY